jgi:uncharacterized membrane protein YgcG
MKVAKFKMIILFNLLLGNSVNGQETNQYEDLNSVVKTVGIIDNEDIYTPLQEKYIDSVLIEFQKKLQIRMVFITGDTALNDKLFWKVRRAWGYTDTKIENDIFVAITCQEQKRIGFWDASPIDTPNWLCSIVKEDTIDSLIRNSWWPYFKKDSYFEALENLLNALLPEIERNADKINYDSCRH